MIRRRTGLRVLSTTTELVPSIQTKVRSTRALLGPSRTRERVQSSSTVVHCRTEPLEPSRTVVMVQSSQTLVPNTMEQLEPRRKVVRVRNNRNWALNIRCSLVRNTRTMVRSRRERRSPWTVLGQHNHPTRILRNCCCRLRSPWRPSGRATCRWTRWPPRPACLRDRCWAPHAMHCPTGRPRRERGRKTLRRRARKH